jgi:hypothetical protein
MSNGIILYGNLALVMLRGALVVCEIVARRTLQRRTEQDHLALLRILVTTIPDTVTAAQHPGGMAGVLPTCPQNSGSEPVISVHGTRRTT